MAATVADPSTAEAVSLVDERLRWPSAWTVHHANHLRDSRDGLKVGGYQAPCSSISTAVAAFYIHALRPHDRVAVNPHAGAAAPRALSGG